MRSRSSFMFWQIFAKNFYLWSPRLRHQKQGTHHHAVPIPMRRITLPDIEYVATQDGILASATRYTSAISFRRPTLTTQMCSNFQVSARGGYRKLAVIQLPSLTCVPERIGANQGRTLIFCDEDRSQEQTLQLYHHGENC